MPRKVIRVRKEGLEQNLGKPQPLEEGEKQSPKEIVSKPLRKESPAINSTVLESKGL